MSPRTDAGSVPDPSSVAGRIETHDWSTTPLGPIEGWPEALKVALQIIISSRFPMFIWWGPQLINIYNDAYAPMLGKKHPAGLGRPAAEVWYEIWDVIGPQTDLVISRQQSTWNEEMLLVMERYGYTEETYFTWSYSPIGVGTGNAAGLFCAVTEDTVKVIGRRRLKTLRELAAETADLRTAPEAFAKATAVIGRNPYDVPFALLYEIDPGGKTATLAGAAGTGPGNGGAPVQVELDPVSNPWGLDLNSEETRRIADLGRWFIDVPRGPWPQPPIEALLVPFAKKSEDQPAGFMIAGVSRYNRLDDDYRGFLALVGRHIAIAVANSRVYEAERQRAEALAELDRAKTAFFSNVSHEFRTPLTLLLGPLEDALANVHGILPMGAARDLSISHRNGLRLLKLVNTLLDFSRIESGRVQVFYQPADLAAHTADLASSFRSLCEKAGLRLIVDCKPFRPDEIAYVDCELWEKIVLNLVSNAFKFTLKGEIEVRLEAVDGHARLTVRDTGVGIPFEELPHMFERFHRIEHNRGRTHEGTGIGLALVQELVKFHHGTIDVASVLGKGSTFTVTIPLGSAHLDPSRVGAAPARAAANASIPYLEEALTWLPDEKTSPSPMARAGAPGPAPFRPDPESMCAAKPRVLWADDNADMRNYVRRLLAGRFDVEAVADGHAALAAARAWMPDLVLSDVMMPGMDGFELLRSLRADSRLREIPIILLSARAGEDSRIEGLNVGADDYLVKPFSARELIARVETHIKISALRREAKAIIQESELRLRTFADTAPAILWTSEPDGARSFFSRGWHEYTGQTQEQALGFGWLNALHPDDRRRCKDVVLGAIQTREAFSLDYRLRRADGAYRWAMGSGRPRFTPEGHFEGFIGSVIEIHERKQAEQTSSLLSAIVDSSDDAIISKDLNGVIMSWNRGAERLFGYTAEEAIGQSILMLIPQDRAGEEPAILDKLKRGERVDHFETVRVRKDGSRVTISLTISPIRDASGAVIGASKIARDIKQPTVRPRRPPAAAPLKMIGAKG